MDEKDKLLKEKDQTIADLQTQLKQVQESLEAKIDNLQQQVVKYGESTEEHLKWHGKRIERLIQGFTIHEFTLTEFTKYQAKGGYGEWLGEPFYTHPGGYKFRLAVETNGDSASDVRRVYLSIHLNVEKGDHDVKLDWPVTARAHVQLLNQLRDQTHHEMSVTGSWKKSHDRVEGGKIEKFIKLTELKADREKHTHYLKDNRLIFRVYIKAVKE